MCFVVLKKSTFYADCDKVTIIGVENIRKINMQMDLFIH